MPRHALRYQCSIPASGTKHPGRVLEKVTMDAAQYLRRLAGPRATEVDIQRRYYERQSKIGMMWDVLVVCQFNGPVEKSWSHIKDFSEIKLQLKRGKGN